MPYACGIARNVFRKYLRRRYRDSVHEPLSDGLSMPQGRVPADPEARRRLLARAMRRLSALDAEVIRLTLQGHRARDVAHRLRLSPAVVRIRKHRAIRKLSAAVPRQTFL